MTDKEFIDNFKTLIEYNKHELKSIMYKIKADKLINWGWHEKDEVDND